ncbi:transposable element Tcb2 transposase [Trichonephila clavipes]|nr:transposable element Tcb2 transposase [Trichonephila clavipes]
MRAALDAHPSTPPFGVVPLTRKLDCSGMKPCRLFSDAREPRFNLSSDDNRVQVWRPRGERLNPAFALQRHAAPTAGVMACAISRSVSNRAYLGRRIGHPTSLNELEARLQQIWNEMSQDIIQNLYASIPDRMAS